MLAAAEQAKEVVHRELIPFVPAVTAAHLLRVELIGDSLLAEPLQVQVEDSPHHSRFRLVDGKLAVYQAETIGRSVAVPCRSGRTAIPISLPLRLCHS